MEPLRTTGRGRAYSAHIYQAAVPDDAVVDHCNLGNSSKSLISLEFDNRAAPPAVLHDAL